MRRSRPPLLFVFLLDVIAICLVLGLFWFLHQTLLKGDTGLDLSLFDDKSPVPESSPLDIAPLETPAPEIVNITPTPSPSPTPAPGDFSATFPDYDTSVGVEALYSYQSDDKRIVVYSGYMEEATYYVADVWIRYFDLYRTGFAGGSYQQGYYEETLEIASAYGATVAITGDFFGSKRSGLVIRNGVLHRDSVAADVCVLYADGVMESYYQKDVDVEAIIARGAYQTWSFGPKLLDNGEAPGTYQRNGIGGRHPRAALGYYEPGHYCLVVVDGRQSGYSRGMTFDHLSDLFISLGCVDAYNLDGGQTAMMVFENEIVNKPYHGGRDVSDIVYF